MRSSNWIIGPEISLPVMLKGREDRVRRQKRAQIKRLVEGVLENVGEDNGIISIHVDSGIKQIDVATIKSARTVYLWESQTGTKRKF